MKKAIKWLLIIALAVFALRSLALSNPRVKESYERGLEAGRNSDIEATSAPVENFKIDVTSQIVKKVGNKYRYFFDIRNNDTKDFEGTVVIFVYNSLGNEIWNNPFKTQSPIEPEMGDSVYFDINTGPTIVHDENGISKFKYEVLINNRKVKEGEGTITDKLEN